MNAKNLSQNFKRAKAKSVVIAAALLVWSLVPTGAQAILATSEPAPSFSLVSGDNKKLSLDMLKGKVVVLFYATRDTVQVNDDLQHYLDTLYDAQPQNIQNQSGTSFMDAPGQPSRHPSNDAPRDGEQLPRPPFSRP